MDAGIPASTSGIYAENFVKHRLKSSMMGDLDKNLLKDLGVDALGDCIAILKKAHNLVNLKIFKLLIYHLVL